MQSPLQRYRVVLLHLSFWCVYASFFLYQISSRPGQDLSLGVIILRAAINVLFSVTVAYLNYFLFLPRFLLKRRLWLYLLEFVGPFALIMFARIQLQRYVVDGYTYQETFFYSTIYIVQVTATTLFIVIFIGLLRFAEDWFELEARKKEIENEKLTAELNFLKAQINPHFLFNTLNNLYYLAYTKSENTTEVIAKLSQMMRYMIYDSNYPQVPLTKEIEYMQNYISLERLRLNNQIPIQFEIKGSTESILITPLIFITFLENAFKHGVSNNSTGSWVNISVEMKGKECIYTVENSKIVKTNPVKEEKSGFGLQNVQRRLELSYPGRFQLKSEDRPDSYFVQLNISLK
jgi:two-component system sensor histidine kinase AlgZ